MKNLQGTKTAENLLKAFAGESQARNKYTFFAETAKEEGYVQIHDFFIKSAENEKAHALVFYNHLLNGFAGQLPMTVQITADYTINKGTTAENLIESAQSEEKESKEIYPKFAQIAREEGFPEVAESFELISSIESHHQQRYLALAENVKENKVFKKDNECFWICTSCGFSHTGTEANEICPVCTSPKDYAKIYITNY